MATPNTGIPYVPENTTDPAAGLNLALNTIDALLQTAVVSMGSNTPPTSPADGALYIVGTAPTGAWAGEANSLARFVAEGAFWQFFGAGDQVSLILNRADFGLYTWNGSAWVPAVAGSAGAVWGSITGTLSAQADLQSALNARLTDAPSDGTQYTRQNGAWAAVAGGGGSGDVVGPSSSVNDRIAVFDGTTGKLLKDGGRTIPSLRSPAVQSVASAGTVTPTFANDLVKITAQAAALTLANPSGTAIDGVGIVIRIKDDGTARAITYGAQYRAIGVTLPTTTVAGKTLYLAGIWNAEDTTLDVVAVGQQA